MIPAEAVEAAARKLYQAGGLTVWDKEDESTQNYYRRNAKSALEAAAPYIRETVTEWAAAFRLTGEPYNFHRTREEAQAFVDSMQEDGVRMIVMTREVLPAQASEWAPYILNNEGEK